MSFKTFVSKSPAGTEKIGEELGKTVKPGTVIALRGEMGAGKTCFTRGFAAGLGFTGDVNSPTFAIVNVYSGGRLTLYHFDMYRISGWDDLYTTGFFEYCDAGGVVIVEWSENIESALPDGTVYITFEKTGESERTVTVEGDL